MKRLNTSRVMAGLDRLSDIGADFGSMRVDLRGHVRRAKTLSELDFDDSTPYACDEWEPDALMMEAWGYTL